ncbi:hypothetical protein MMC14_001054 [Varicellaria rhodocarpa]|nr:hypothetical protein [Varicellaria rhodocarpa]
MRIRLPFAASFTILLLLSAYLGLTPLNLSTSPVNDKLLHLLTFFLLTLTFYWILDTTRRRALNITFPLITAFFGIASEFLQAFLPNGRQFDVLDIVANVVGSGAALGICTWYHRRMLERKRKRKFEEGYVPVDGEGEGDLELGEGGGIGAQETGVIAGEEEEEDESGEAWDDIGGEESGSGDGGGGERGKMTPSSGSVE